MAYKLFTTALPKICLSCVHFDVDEEKKRGVCNYWQPRCVKLVTNGQLPDSFERNYDDKDVERKIAGVIR